MSLKFSPEEKELVLLYLEKHPLESDETANESKWQYLACELGRNWEEVREAHRRWKIDEENFNVNKHENDQNVATVSFNRGTDIIEEHYELLEEIHLENIGSNNNENGLHQLNLNDEWVKIDGFEQYIIDSFEESTNVNCNNDCVVEVGLKRHCMSDFDMKLLRSFELQSKQELELKKEEHEKKMKIYKMQLENGQEEHKEKMKILRAKLRAAQEQISHIDHTLCNIRKKFKSGPI